MAAWRPAGLSTRRVVEIATTLILTAILAVGVVVHALRQGDKLPWPHGFAVATEAEGADYLDARPAPEAPHPDDAPLMVEAGAGPWREDFENLDGWLRWRGPLARIESGDLLIAHQPGYEPVLYATQPWVFSEGVLEVRMQCDRSGFGMGLGEFRGTPWRELGGRMNSPNVRDGLFIYMNRRSLPHVVGLHDSANDVNQFQTQAPISKVPLGSSSTLQLTLRPNSVALAVDDVEYLVEQLEWSDAPRRIYLGTTQADTRVEWMRYVPADADAPSSNQ